MDQEELPPTMQFVEGCPGCTMELKKLMNKGIPHKELFFVAITSNATGNKGRLRTNKALASMRHIATNNYISQWQISHANKGSSIC
jgi:hypothetical protein